ncbi:MAG: GNAT family N-acetyltransferase [Motiliproteus sp.]
MNANIRQYQQRDQNELMAAWEAANSLAHSFLDNDFVAQVRRDIPAVYLPNADTWVAEIDQCVVGFIALMGHQVGALFLQPEHHGKGIGKALMDKAQTLHGYLEVEVFKANAIGRKFYASYGFKLQEQKCDQKPEEALAELAGHPVLRLKFSASQ